MVPSVVSLPKLAEVNIQIGPFDENLTGKTFPIYAINEKDVTDRIEVSDSNGIAGAALDTTYIATRQY